MTLKEFLSLIADEEARIELELDIEMERDYSYISFWLSDFREGKYLAGRKLQSSNKF